MSLTKKVLGGILLVLVVAVAAAAVAVSHTSPCGLARCLATLGDLIEQGKVKPVIDRRYPLSRTADALRYLETGRARGKVVIDVP